MTNSTVALTEEELDNICKKTEPSNEHLEDKDLQDLGMTVSPANIHHSEEYEHVRYRAFSNDSEKSLEF